MLMMISFKHVLSRSPTLLTRPSLFASPFLFPDQQTAYRHHAVQFLRLFGEYYMESKMILKAQREGSAYRTRNCTVKLNFQPRDRIVERPAYLSLKSEISSFSDTCKQEGGQLYLRGLLINNDDRKLELTEMLCAALADFAALVLVQFDLDEMYDRHDLVADMLLCHHTDLLSLLRLNLHYLLDRYKIKHKCGRPLSTKKSGEALYNLLYPSVAGKNAAVASAGSTAAAALSVTPASSTPSVSRVLQYPPNSSNEEAKEPEATPKPPEASNSKSNLPSPYRKATQVLQDAMAEAMTALTSIHTGSRSKDANVSNDASAPSDSDAQNFDSGPPDDELVALLEQVELKNLRLKECRDLVEIDSIRNKSRLAIPPSTPPDSNAPPAFQSPPESIDTNPADSSTAQTSITTASKAAETSTKDNAAPPAPSTDAPVQVLTINRATIEEPSVDTTAAVSTLWKALSHCFVQAPSAYLTQHSYNIAANKMSRLSTSKLKTDSANKTLEILATEGTPSMSDPTPRTINSSIDRKVKRATDDTKRKIQSSTDVLLSEINALKKANEVESAKRRKLEATVNEMKQASKSNEGNDERGPATGANQNNQSGKKSRRSKKKKINAAPPSQATKSNPTRRRGKSKQAEAAGADNDSSNDSPRQTQQRSHQRSVLKKNLTWTRPIQEQP